MIHPLHIHIVTYADNARHAVHALSAVRKAWPTAPVTILDDVHHPIDDDTRRKLETGAAYRCTRWKRGGNLRGPSCIRGLLREYRRAVQAGAAYVLKLDADTLVLNSAPIMGMMAQGIDYGTHTTLDAPWGGGYILLSAFAVENLYHAARRLNMASDCREDITQGALATACGLQVCSLDGNTPCTEQPVFYTGVDTHQYGDSDYMARLARLVAVASVGTSKLTGAPRTTEVLAAQALLESLQKE